MAKMGRPKLDKTKKKVLSVRLSDELSERLLVYTEKHNESMTKVAIKALEDYLNQESK